MISLNAWPYRFPGENAFGRADRGLGIVIDYVVAGHSAAGPDLSPGLWILN